jgi:hypothetical protein
MFSNTKQKLESEMIHYLLIEKRLTTSKIINAFDDQHRTAVRMQKYLLYKQYRLPCCIASTRGHVSSNELCEVATTIWRRC